jgi:hypothetical protein
MTPSHSTKPKRERQHLDQNEIQKNKNKTRREKTQKRKKKLEKRETRWRTIRAWYSEENISLGTGNFSILTI